MRKKCSRLSSRTAGTCPFLSGRPNCLLKSSNETCGPGRGLSPSKADKERSISPIQKRNQVPRHLVRRVIPQKKESGSAAEAVSFTAFIVARRGDSRFLGNARFETRSSGDIRRVSAIFLLLSRDSLFFLLTRNLKSLRLAHNYLDSVGKTKSYKYILARNTPSNTKTRLRQFSFRYLLEHILK
jgi:hypothetical protein